MARDDTDIVTALAADEVQIFNAVEIVLDNRSLRFWTGYDYRALGNAFSVSNMQIGDWYEIASLGNTFWSVVGGPWPSPSVGDVFQATDIGTGTGTVKKAYTGTGTLMSINGVAEKSDMSVPSVSIVFDGISSDIVSLALQEPYQRRECIVYFGVGNDPYYITEAFSGELDTVNIRDTGEASVVEVTATNRMVKLERANSRRYTSESHKARYPNDTFFDTVTSIQDVSVSWGRS